MIGLCVIFALMQIIVVLQDIFSRLWIGALLNEVLDTINACTVPVMDHLHIIIIEVYESGV